MARVNTIAKAITTAGTELPASSVELWVSWFIVEFKSGNTGSNGYRSCSTTCDNTYPAITEAKPFSWAIAGQNFNLAELYLDVDTSGDGFWITYGIAQNETASDIT